MKIFNEEVYVGPSMTFVELTGSDFYSSYVQVALVHRLFLVTDSTQFKVTSDGRQIRLADKNIFFEVFINSQAENFFKYLAIRAGILLPLTWDKGTFDDIQFRITVAVPVGRVIRF